MKLRPFAGLPQRSDVVIGITNADIETDSEALVQVGVIKGELTYKVLVRLNISILCKYVCSYKIQ